MWLWDTLTVRHEYTDRNREVWLFLDVQKKAFPFLLHFLFNFSLFSSYFLITKCLKDACESVECTSGFRVQSNWPLALSAGKIPIWTKKRGAMGQKVFVPSFLVRLSQHRSKHQFVWFACSFLACVHVFWTWLSQSVHSSVLPAPFFVDSVITHLCHMGNILCELFFLATTTTFFLTILFQTYKSMYGKSIYILFYFIVIKKAENAPLLQHLYSTSRWKEKSQRISVNMTWNG